MDRLHFEEAVAAIQAEARPGEKRGRLPIESSAGLVLAEDVVADIDMPAFDRAAMDGFAFRHEDGTADRAWRIVGQIAAGAAATPVELAQGQCVKIMTGAVVPSSADTIIPVEATSGFAEIGMDVRFEELPAKGAHIAPRGQNLRSGEPLLSRGRLLQAQEIGMLAAVGCRQVDVYLGPQIAFAATGDELREPGEPLPQACIRNSNAYSLWAQILAARAEPDYIGILRDEPDSLRQKLAAALERADLVVLTGGVSMGEYDYIPGILAELGVRICFQKLWVRPGQPTLFGYVEQAASRRTLVFGLPGNPISTLLAFDQYVLPAIRAFRRAPLPVLPKRVGRLTAPTRTRPGFTSLVPCRTEWKEDRYRLHPLKTHGSADIFATRGADAVAIVPPREGGAPAGTRVAFRTLYQP